MMDFMIYKEICATDSYRKLYSLYICDREIYSLARFDLYDLI